MKLRTTTVNRLFMAIIQAIAVFAICLLSPVLGFSLLSAEYLAGQQRADFSHDRDSGPSGKHPYGIDQCSLPTFENSLETDHFVLRWTNRSSNAADNIPSQDVIRETAQYLETARSKYIVAFGKAPLVSAGKSKMEVLFLDLECFGEADPPEGPIRLDADSWMKKPGIRRPTSAHELFHKLQYAFGYRTKWKPKRPFLWFTEGTAAWAETFVWQQVSSSYKVKELFRKPATSLYESDDSAAPFWIYFQNRCRSTPDSNPMAELFQLYEKNGNEREALTTIVGKAFRATRSPLNTLDLFFAEFARERRLGQLCQTHYPDKQSHGAATISGPDGSPIHPSLKVFEISMHNGKEYSNSGEVSKLGSGYYRFRFEPSAHGRILSLRISGDPEGSTNFFLGWERNGRWQEDIRNATGGTEGNCRFAERIDLDRADSLMLIISGSAQGGTYAIRASMS